VIEATGPGPAALVAWTVNVLEPALLLETTHDEPVLARQPLPVQAKLVGEFVQLALIVVDAGWVGDAGLAVGVQTDADPPPVTQVSVWLGGVPERV